MALLNRNIQNPQSDLFQYYLTMNINNICRICLEKGSKLMPIFDPVKPPHFSILIMACAAVQVLEEDGLPRFICQKCVTKLNVAFQFKTQCESSDSRLRQCLANLQHLPTASDLSGFIELKKEHTHDTHYHNNAQISNHLSHLDDNTTTLRIVESNNIHLDETNVLEESHLETLHNVELVSEEPLTVIDKNELNELKLEFGDSHLELKVGDLALVDLGQQTNKFRRHLKQHQCDTCGKIFRNKPGLIHHIRIHTGERPYVCHLCDKRFINGGHLHTHMRTHTGEKNHVCAACNKAFATTQQLTKHTIAIHTSERPYGCSYCSKRFASSSNLNTHTRIHTGEKNYHCDQCAKAFSTKGQLYQHMLVHTGEKAFLCEYCNKRFSQKAHLIRHLKMHKS